MRKLSHIALGAFVACCVVSAADWPALSGNPQRDGWAKAEKAFTKENAGKIELLYKYKAENQVRGSNSISTPIVNGFLITHQGFKEMLGFAGSGDNAWSVDADLNRVIWKVHFDYKAAKPPVSASTALCPGGLTASMAMPGSSTAAATRGGGGVRGSVPQLLSLGNFGRGANFAVISGDGTLHVLNSATGAERTTPIPFVPPNAKLSALNINNNIVYAATQDGCGGNANAIYAMDLTPEAPKPVMLETNGAAASGNAGTAIASDGTVFVQVADGKNEVAGQYNDTVLALSPDLKVKDYFTPASAPLDPGKSTAFAGATPVIFTWKGRELVVAAGRDGRIHLLDAKAPGGTDHQTSLFSTASASPEGFRGAFASWEEENNGPRWVYASTPGAVVAFQLEEHDGKLALTQKWTSRAMQAPAPVVTANGVVFALATGQAIDRKPSTRAVFYALDALTGQELYTSGNMTSAFSSAGIAVANRRIYFTTHDNLVYSLGFLVEQPQLTGK